MVRRKTRWYVSRFEVGKRKRTFFDSKAEAEAEAEQLRLQTKTAGEVWLSLPAHERERLVQAYARALERGVDLVQAIDSAIAQPATDNGPTLSKAISDILEAKEKSGRSDKYVSALKTAFNQFQQGREDIRISKIGLHEIETFLDSKQLASRSTLRSRLSTLFKFAIRRGYRMDNPCARLESVTMPHKTPAIFTVKQIETCLGFFKANRKAFPWFVLSTFCGLRPEEAQQTRRRDIHIKEGWIKVEAQTTKVRQRRVVYPRPEAIALLKRSLKGGKLPLNATARRRAMRALRDKLNWKAWPKDVTRHTAASYWLAAETSTSHVADMLGHSESILRKNYKALVTKEQAKEFWEMVGKNKSGATLSSHPH